MGGEERRLQGQLYAGGGAGAWTPLHQRALLGVLEEAQLQTEFYQEVRAGLTASTGKERNSIGVCMPHQMGY